MHDAVVPQTESRTDAVAGEPPPAAPRGLVAAELSSLQRALVALRGMRSAEQVMTDGAASLLDHWDFDRVAVFGVEAGAAVPQHTLARRTRLQGTSRTAKVPEIRPDDLAEVLRRRQPMLVAGVRCGAPASCPPLSPAQPSFVVAPVAPSDEAIALLAADRSPWRGVVDELDRAALALFAEAFGLALERAIVLERLNAQRSHFKRLATTGSAIMKELCEAPVRVTCGASDAWWDLPTAGPSSAVPPLVPRRVAEPPADLSAREREVLELMVSGARNREIAARLFVSEDTVKSHVRRVLRKLGAANRAEAVSRYLRLTDPPRLADTSP